MSDTGHLLNALVRRFVGGRPAFGLVLVGVGAVATGCEVSTFSDAPRPAVANTCTTDRDCGASGVCTDGACYARSGAIDEVLLEIVPETNSPLGNVSFLSVQDNLRRGDRARNIPLVGPVTFQAQVQVNGEDLDAACPYLHTGKQSISARITFTRTGAIGGASVSGLSNRFTLTVDTEPSGSGFSKSVSLVPGSYDIYAQPVASSNCQIASKIWRDVDVGRDGQVAAWAPPATLELPKPVKLEGRVERAGESLADWQVELIDPQDAKVISTSARLGATTDASPATNFAVTFQPLGNPGGHDPSSDPLIRLRPPKDLENKLPVVYFDLAGLGTSGTGQVSVVLSRLPTAGSMVTVNGQVRGFNDEGVRSTVQFVNTTFIQMLGLPASFGPAVTTDASGHYTVPLYPGNYRVVIVPEGAASEGMAVPGTNPRRAWALTELATQSIGTESTQTVDLTVAPTRIIEGVATAVFSGRPAQGANLEASPIRGNPSSVLDAVRSPTITPPHASVAVDDTNGRFSLVLDPGDYDFALQPAPASNFGWWLLPNVRVVPSQQAGQVGMINPQLAYPVPLGGTITVTMPDKTSQPLRNATLKAYAQADGRVTQVGMAHTDDMGRYYLPLPPGFFTSQ